MRFVSGINSVAGGYSSGEHSEDYRWVWLKSKLREHKLPPALFSLFNLVFIATYQHFLIWLFTSPSYVASASAYMGWTTVDTVATVGFLGAVALETVADNQQWEFYEVRRKVREGKLKANELEAGVAADVQRGFLSRGLFAYSRHPNFFGEQAVWWSYYLFAVSASGNWLNWSGAGVFLLSLLFQGTGPITEYISTSKYPEYTTYQRRVPRAFVPWPWKAAITRDGRFKSELN
ncbi:hypothetical protein HDU93_009114 [Gonapodya sp. JEL0774]|nr:hypothetical protein HDU93_009114 [Gonapodya sp. JEL0774]